MTYLLIGLWVLTVLLAVAFYRVLTIDPQPQEPDIRLAPPEHFQCRCIAKPRPYSDFRTQAGIPPEPIVVRPTRQELKAAAPVGSANRTLRDVAIEREAHKARTYNTRGD